MEQELLILPSETTHGICLYVVRIVWLLVFCAAFSRSMFVFLSLLFCPLYCRSSGGPLCIFHFFLFQKGVLRTKLEILAFMHTLFIYFMSISCHNNIVFTKISLLVISMKRSNRRNTIMILASIVVDFTCFSFFVCLFAFCFFPFVFFFRFCFLIKICD